MQRNIKKLFACVTVAGIMLCCCGEKAGTGVSPAPVYALDTVFTQKIFDGDAKCAAGIAEMLASLESRLSRYASGSEISAVNGAGGEPVTVSDDTAGLLKSACDINEKSGGAFDITLGKISSMYDFESGRIPSASELSAAMTAKKGSSVTVSGNVVTLTGDAEVDLGGIAKGMAINRIIDIYKGGNIKRAVVSCSSSIGIIGSASIGLRDPDKTANDIIAKLPLSDAFVSTSGDYERSTVIDGVRYHHIISPETGEPVRNGLRAVTVIGADCAVTDALSTAAFVLGLEQGVKLVADMGYQCIFITEDKTIYASGELSDLITLTDSGYKLGKI